MNEVTQTRTSGAVTKRSPRKQHKNGQKNGEAKRPFFRNLYHALVCSQHSGAMVPQNARNKGEVAVCTEEVHTITERAGQTEEAERSPLSPDFHFEKSESKKSGDNSDLKLFCPRSGQV
nr:hypothetical protein [Paenibacillus xylanexedens]